MSRLTIFIGVRLIALLWVLALANLAHALGPWTISLLILASEALLGYAWGRAESRVQVCMPSTPDPKRLFVLMILVAIVESAAAFLLVHMFAPWLILWRVLTSYMPFVIVEILVYRRMCKA